MVKKSLLLFSMILMISADSFAYPYYYSYRKDPTFWENYGLHIVGGVSAITVATYLYQRESNRSLIQKTNYFYKKAYEQLHNTHGDIVQFGQNADIETSEREIIFKSKYLMTNRYTSWLKPWDWSADMKLAHKRIRAAAILYGYLPLLLKSENLTGEDVLRFARETFVCINQYPCVFCLINLQQDIAYLKKHMKNIDPDVLPTIKQILQVLIKARNILRSEKEFIDEFNVKTQHDLQRAQLMATLSKNY